MKARSATCDDIEAAMEWVITKLDSHKGDQEFCHQLLFSVREALNNVVEHSGATTFSIRLRAFERQGQPWIGFRCRDNGKGYVIPSHNRSQPLALQGRGWPIIKAWTDSVRLRRLGEINELTLFKNVQPGNKSIK
ncbi:ATP-binding protein [Marinobacter sp. CA1]|uniref:ATP-binding protein n=1 Tax=Marinobacter sp. CA1 TaxID=2817656 RepID=UPI001D089FA4|nr:ATP-binding protein [Marinobacter sp. CA1]UDL07038.1 ATP-binding protein [Marinobacter sp. CA1]